MGRLHTYHWDRRPRKYGYSCRIFQIPHFSAQI